MKFENLKVWDIINSHLCWHFMKITKIENDILYCSLYAWWRKNVNKQVDKDYYIQKQLDKYDGNL